jgi:transcriptional regulator GlxA family with amidase domain
MSERTFARRFVAETGTTPLRWLSNQRVAMACQLLEQTSAPVDEVARRSGLGSSDNLRVQLRRHLTTTPTGVPPSFLLSEPTEPARHCN